MTTVVGAVAALVAVAPLVALGLAVLLEGPIATVVAGSLVGAGHLSWWTVLLTVVVADLLADSVFYLLGRRGFGPRTRRLLSRIGVTESQWAALRETVSTQLPRVVIGAKLVDIGAIPAFLATGMARVPYRRVLAWNAPATAMRAAALTSLGALVGGRLADDVLANPWLAAGCGIALGLVLLAIQAVVTRITARRGASI